MAQRTTPGPVPEEAIRFLASKGLRPGFDFRDVWNEEHAHAFTVAKLMDRDLLADVQAELGEHLEQGLPFTEFQNRLKPILQKRGWWGEKEMTDPVTGETFRSRLGSPSRLKTIYETNMRSARSVGQWKRIERTADTRPFLLYRVGPSEKHRPQHLAWDGMILPIDHPFWSMGFPPNGYGCKCRVRQISAREVERMGGIVEPDFEMVAMENSRTGDVVRTIRGIDPSFAYNPGKVGRRV